MWFPSCLHEFLVWPYSCFHYVSNERRVQVTLAACDMYLDFRFYITDYRNTYVLVESRHSKQIGRL